jgi:hypothetical protein
MHQVGYLPGISAGCTGIKTLNDGGYLVHLFLYISVQVWWVL